MGENKYLENQNETMGENSFMKTLLKKRLNQKGLTLIELLAVIVILAIVAAIAIPAIGNIIENSRIKAAKADAVLVLNAAQLYVTDGNTIADDETSATLQTNGYLEGTNNIETPLDVDQADGEITVSGTIGTGDSAVTFAGASLADIDPNTTEDDTNVTVAKNQE